jgi:predicted O-methyltransferase YrrM
MTTYDDEISAYITDLFASHDQALQHAWDDTPRKGLPAISVRPEEGRFLQFLACACRATKALEFGTLGGYSSIWIARGLATGGRLITVEMEPHHAEIARQHFAVAGLTDQIEVRVGNAHELLPDLAQEAPFDLVFIDAEKPGYPEYFAWAMENTRLGGVIAAHNAFRGGKVIAAGPVDEATETMRAFNRRVSADPRVISTIYPSGDGTLIAVKIA